MLALKFAFTLDEGSFERLEARLSDMSPVMRVLSQHLLKVAQGSFAGEQTPARQPWARLSPHTINWRLRNGYGAGPILTNTGKLKNSLQSAFEAHSAVVGTRVRYAPFHMRGRPPGASSGFMPARPFLGLAPETETTLVDAIERHLFG